MGRLVVTEFVTLDGVMEDPGGSEKTARGGWAFQFNRGPEGDKFKLDETMETEALLLGRVTYQGFAEAWPSRTGEFADKFNSLPKYVVSHTLQQADWQNSKIIRGNVAQEVSRLKEAHRGPIVVHGSARLVQALMQNALVDEYRLMVYPIVLGTGKRLFEDGLNRLSLRLVEAKPVGEGILILIYHPEGR